MAQTAGDYKALVCIFLFGGNDAGNMVIPDSDYASSAGWGGRFADKTADLNITTFPPITSVAGTPIFTSGNIERPLAIAAAPTRLDGALRLDGFPNPPDNDARYQTLQSLLQLDQMLTLVRGASRVTNEALMVERALRTAGD